MQQEKEKFELSQLISQFLEKTNSGDVEMAKIYLKRYSLNLQKALDTYFVEIQVQESIKKKRFPLKNTKNEILPKSEISDTTGLLSSKSYNQYYHHSFESTSRKSRELNNEVYQVSKTKKKIR